MYGLHHHLHESQELMPAFKVIGIVFIRSSHLLETRSAIAHQMAGYVVGGTKAITIHTRQDMILAEKVLVQSVRAASSSSDKYENE